MKKEITAKCPFCKEELIMNLIQVCIIRDLFGNTTKTIKIYRIPTAENDNSQDNNDRQPEETDDRQPDTPKNENGDNTEETAGGRRGATGKGRRKRDNRHTKNEQTTEKLRHERTKTAQKRTKTERATTGETSPKLQNNPNHRGKPATNPNRTQNAPRRKRQRSGTQKVL